MRIAMIPALAATVFAVSLAAQAPSTPPSGPRALGMIVYPGQGQPPEQQAKDEAACTQWAESQTGLKVGGGQVDPNAAAQAAQDQASQATQGAAVAGAAKGALVGGAMGAVYGNGGEGAAVGAIAGAIGGRRARKQAEAQAAQQGAAQAQAHNQAAIDQLKKAVGVCLTGRGYTVS